MSRRARIARSAPERYATHAQNGVDHSARSFGFGFNGADGMTVTITRDAGTWRYFVDGLEWNPLSPTTFLDGRSDLTAGLFAITPLNANRKTIDVDAFSLVVNTGEPALTALPQGRILHFARVTGDGIAADHADPDRDGRSNRREFELGTDPLERD